MITYVSYRLAAFVSRTLAPRACYRLAGRVAAVFHALDRAGRHAVERNLAVVLRARGGEPDPAELRRLARLTFENFGKYLADFFRYSRSSASEVARMIRIENGDYMRQATALERGVLVASGHVGNWELGGMLVSSMGYRLNAVAMPQRLQNVNRLFEAQRAGRGIRVLPLGHAAKGILLSLRRREWVALLADRDFNQHSPEALFFGRPARLPRGPAYLAVRTRAPVLPGFVLRQPDDTFVLRFFPPIIPDERTTQEDVQGRICRVLEDVIGAHPAQWFMFRDLWGDGPNGPAG